MNAPSTEIAKKEPSYSQRFTNMVVQEFGQEVGEMELSPYQRRLAQHLFVCIDTQLKALEVKNQDKGKGAGLPIVWANVNMAKLALDSVHRVELGLDALIPNHIHPIPYFNKRTKKYDVDLRIGYVGKDCYRRKVALDPVKDIIYELVHENDIFRPKKKTFNNLIESYDFTIEKPFDRGKVVGGFGYIIYEDAERNKLVIVTNEDFDKSKKAAQSKTFWDGHPQMMQMKTLVHRVTSKIQIDPEKVNASLMHAEIDEEAEAVERNVEEFGGKEPIDVDSSETQTDLRSRDWFTKEQEEEIDAIKHKVYEMKTEPLEERQASGAPTTFEPDDEGREKPQF